MQTEPPQSVRTTIFTEAAYRIAAAVIGRDCRFAGLAICVLPVAQINQPAVAMATGGILNILGSAILLALAWQTERRQIQRSEIWRSMKPELRLAPEAAVPLLRVVLRATYLRFARIAAWAGAWFLAMAGLYASYMAWRMG